MPLEFRPKYEKIVELLLYLAHVRPGADKYQAVKFFYLADREHLVRHGRPITQEEYFALKYGPVASTAMDLLEKDPRAFRKANIEALPFRTEILRVNGRLLTYIREPLRNVDPDVFSRSDLRVFDGIIEAHGQKSFDELYELTHSHFAYKRAWRDREGNSNAMRYAEMIDDPARRAAIMEDIGPVAANL